MSNSNCSVCGKGNLHSTTSKMVVLKGLGRHSKAGELLRGLRFAKDQGWSLHWVGLTTEGDIPVLDRIEMECLIYSCDNPDCGSFTLFVQDSFVGVKRNSLG